MNRKTLFFTLLIVTAITFEIVMGYVINNIINKIGNTNELGEILKVAIFFIIALAAALSPIYILYLVVSRYLPPAPPRPAPTPRPHTPPAPNATINQEIFGKILCTIVAIIIGFGLSHLVKAGFNSGQLSENEQYIGLGVSIALSIALAVWTWSRR